MNTDPEINAINITRYPQDVKNKAIELIRKNKKMAADDALHITLSSFDEILRKKLQNKSSLNS